MYRVRDMVFFGHVKHASVDCAECHGVMYQTAALEKPFRATTMVACVDCHKQNKASINCSICHELGQ